MPARDDGRGQRDHGAALHKVADTQTGCGWRAGVKADVGLQVYGFKTVAAAEAYLQGGPVSDFELCVEPPNQFLPGSGLGNEAWLDSCNSNVAFRVGRITGEVTTFSADLREGSRTDSRRTTAIARTAVKRLRGLRCPPSFCRGT